MPQERGFHTPAAQVLINGRLKLQCRCRVEIWCPFPVFYEGMVSVEVWCRGAVFNKGMVFVETWCVDFFFFLRCGVYGGIVC